MFRFVKKNLLPREYVDEALRLRKRLERMREREILDLSASYYHIEPYTSELFLVRDPEYSHILSRMARGYIYPSWFIKYRACARRFYLYIRSLIDRAGYYPVSINALKSLVIGKMLHELYSLKYGHLTEIRMELVDPGTDPPILLIGRPDDVLFTGDKVIVYELKTGFSVSDLVGASLQAYSYEYILRKQGYNNVEAYVVWFKGAVLVDVPVEYFLEYYKRIRTIIDLAIKGKDMPPRLSGRLRDKRCSGCAFRRECLQLPDRYNGDWSQFFAEHGLRLLRQQLPPSNPVKT